MLKLFAAFAGVALSKVEIKDRAHTETEYWQLWQKFLAQFEAGMARYHDHAEYNRKFEVFKDNMDKAKMHNEEEHGWTMGITQFADQTEQEFEAFLAKSGPFKRQEGNHVIFDASQYAFTPDSKDWVSEGAVTPVKNQGSCGSCWAFSTTGSLEGANKLQSGGDGILASLSEQELVDCSKSAGNMGCNGGLMDNAFKWIKSNGLCLESAYPYTGQDGTCKKSRCQAKISTIKSWTDVSSEEDLATAVGNEGPVSIAVDANAKWQLYTGGVMSSMFCPKNSLDHGVLAVGYDQSAKYWKIKNSWGTTWGEAGYVRLVLGENACGLANQPSYPNL